jgi:hypothetical protein
VSRIAVVGSGAVSPAGWGTNALVSACKDQVRLPAKQFPCPGYPQPLQSLATPPRAPRPAFLSHPRLRRTSPIAQFAVASSLEALGEDATAVASGSLRLGIIYCSMSGCVTFSRRFYDETLKDPATASPVIFPETVFNAPSSHLGALLGSQGINYTLVGDPGTFVQGLALAGDWLQAGLADGCLVIGAEELDWLIAEAFDLFNPEGTVSEGAGALYLRRLDEHGTGIELKAVTDSHLFSTRRHRKIAAQKARSDLGPSDSGALLCDGLQGIKRIDEAEEAAWSDWSGDRWSPKRWLGEGFLAASAWQCVAATQALTMGLCHSSTVSVVGYNQQAIACRFAKY